MTKFLANIAVYNIYIYIYTYIHIHIKSYMRYKCIYNIQYIYIYMDMAWNLPFHIWGMNIYFSADAMFTKGLNGYPYPVGRTEGRASRRANRPPSRAFLRCLDGHFPGLLESAERLNLQWFGNWESDAFYWGSSCFISFSCNQTKPKLFRTNLCIIPLGFGTSWYLLVRQPVVTMFGNQKNEAKEGWACLIHLFGSLKMISLAWESFFLGVILVSPFSLSFQH